MIIKYNSLTINCLVVRVVVYRSRNVRLFERPRCSEIAIKTRQQSVFAPGSLLLYVILYTSKISTPLTFGLPRLTSFPCFPGHQCIIQTNRYTRAKRYSGLCAHFHYIRVRVRRTRYTHYVHRIRVSYFYRRPAREEREDCPNHGIRVTAMIIRLK